MLSSIDTLDNSHSLITLIFCQQLKKIGSTIIYGIRQTECLFWYLWDKFTINYIKHILKLRILFELEMAIELSLQENNMQEQYSKKLKANNNQSV